LWLPVALMRPLSYFTHVDLSFARPHVPGIFLVLEPPGADAPTDLSNPQFLMPQGLWHDLLAAKC
jgi:hypothetical protein